MFEWMKKHFIPSKNNDYQPHFLRLRIALRVLLLVLVIETTYLLATVVIFPRSDQFAAIFATVLIDQTNEQREVDKLSLLRVNPKLELAARLKAEDMASKGYFAHDSPDGVTPWHWFEEAGYDYAAAGENLAVNFTDSTDVTEAWMRSPLHRANILNGNYTEIGIATALGVHKGKPAIFVVQEFGRPAVKAVHFVEEKSITTPVKPTVPAKAIKPTPKVVTETVVATKLSQAVVEVDSVELPPPVTLVAGAETVSETIVDGVATSAPEGEMPYASTVETIVASPRNTTSVLYVILGLLLTVALALTVFIEIRIQHPHIIVGAIMLIGIIVTLLALNLFIVQSSGFI